MPDILLERFQFEMRCVSNHTACRFAEKRSFSATLGRAALCRRLRVSTLKKLKRSGKSSRLPARERVRPGNEKRPGNRGVQISAPVGTSLRMLLSFPSAQRAMRYCAAGRLRPSNGEDGERAVWLRSRAGYARRSCDCRGPQWPPELRASSISTKTKTAGAAGFAIAHQFHGQHLAVFGKQSLHFVFGGGPGKVADIDGLGHSKNLMKKRPIAALSPAKPIPVTRPLKPHKHALFRLSTRL